MNSYNKLQQLYDLVKNKHSAKTSGKLKVGVDLGTADIVLVAVDEDNNPVAGAMEWASVVKDGLVVDYAGAISIVRKLKAQVEATLGIELSKASVAVPPGTVGRNAEACGHVIAAAGLEPVQLVDEPVAAAKALGIENGIVVDIGGGTTGVAVLKDGNVIFTADEATGGTHLSLVLAGSYKIDFTEAEAIKKNIARHKEIVPVVRPVIEKMATITRKMLHNYEGYPIYVVGGTAYLSGFETEFSKYYGCEVIVPPHPLLVTPLGIAMFG